MTGWWLTYPSEKYEFVSWDDEIPNIWKNKIHVPNHQPDYIQCGDIVEKNKSSIFQQATFDHRMVNSLINLMPVPYFPTIITRFSLLNHNKPPFTGDFPQKKSLNPIKSPFFIGKSWIFPAIPPFINYLNRIRRATPAPPPPPPRRRPRRRWRRRRRGGGGGRACSICDVYMLYIIYIYL